MRSSSSSDAVLKAPTLTFDRVDLGSGDSIKVFDGSNSMMVELRKGPNTDMSQMPLVLTTQSSIMVIEFLSDGKFRHWISGILYRPGQRSFWDVYIVLGLSSLWCLHVCVASAVGCAANLMLGRSQHRE